MANAATLKGNLPIRAMIVGRPKSGKTGSLVALAEAGFKLRVLDYEGNFHPVLQFASDYALNNIDVVNLSDELRAGDRWIETRGMPEAFNRGLQLLKHWRYKDEAGNDVDLGSSADWGPDTVVVLDNFTFFGEAAYDRALRLANKTPLNANWRVWQFAQADQKKGLRLMAARGGRYHFLVMSHLKMIGPDLPEQDDDDLTKELKERAAAVIPTRLYPSALGQALPPLVSAELPIIIHAAVKNVRGRDRRVFNADPTGEVDLALPIRNAPRDLPIETGLLTIFEALGVKPPDPERARAFLSAHQEKVKG